MRDLRFCGEIPSYLISWTGSRNGTLTRPLRCRGAQAEGQNRDNRRDFPGGFPGDLRNAFTAAGRNAQQQEIFTVVQTLLTLRKNHPALGTGKQWHIGWDDNYYAFSASYPTKSCYIYNNAEQTRELSIPIENTPLEFAHRLQSIFGNASAELVAGRVRISLPAQTLAIFSAH